MLRDPAFFWRPNNTASRGRGGGKNGPATKFRKNDPQEGNFLNSFVQDCSSKHTACFLVVRFPWQKILPTVSSNSLKEIVSPYIWARQERSAVKPKIAPSKNFSLTYWKLFFLDLFNLSLGKKKRNLIISVCIKLSRNLEILGFLREQILSKNLGESPWTGNNSLSIIPKISENLTFQAHVNSLHFWGEPTLAARLLFFCAWVSHVMLTPIRKCVLHPTLT